MELTHHFQDIVWPTSAETSNLPTNRWVTVKVLPEETFKDGAEALWGQLTQQGFPLSTKETSELRITLSNIQWDTEGEEDTFGGYPKSSLLPSGQHQKTSTNSSTKPSTNSPTRL